jgi:coproporphyrinogen III oxidase
MTASVTTIAKSLLHTWAIFILLAAPVLAAADDDRLDLLPPDQRAMAEYFNGFLDQMDEKYFGRVGQMNGGLELENRTVEDEYTLFDLRATRGDVMEKAGRMYTMGFVQHPARGGRDMRWSRFYALDMHPKTPLVGMLHAAIVLQFFADGSATSGGWLGYLPGPKIDEDLAQLKQSMDAYFAESDIDVNIYRDLVCKGTFETVTEFRRRPACVGVSFYGPPVYPGDTDKSIKFIAGAYDEFVDAYMNITEKRANDPFTDEDVMAQEKMRKRWLVDQLFSDPYASKVMPFEAWSFSSVPPMIKF